jgi:hypothetical protein
MSTSGSTDWALTRAQTNDASDALNAIIKAFHADGMPLWAITAYSFTTVAGTDSYTIGPSKTLNTAAYPLKIIQASYTLSGGSDVPMNIYNRQDFVKLPSSSAITGNPINLYYQPLSTYGVINLWPIPVNSTTTIIIHYQRPFEDMDSTTDNFDFPAYWTQALIYYLAWALAPEYGIPPTDRGILQKEAMYWKAEALSYGSEEGSLIFQPDTK